MESCFPKAVEKLVAGAITELGDQPAWWYSIDGEKDDLSSMANLFEVDNTLLHQMLLACGLYYPILRVASSPVVDSIEMVLITLSTATI